MKSRHAHCTCSVIWVVSLAIPVMFLVVDRRNVLFDYRTSVCSYHFTDKRWVLLKPLQALFFMIIPNCVVVVVNVMLIVHLIKARQTAQRAGGTRRWQGIITTVLTATVYCISVLPYAIYRIAESKSRDRTSFFHTHYLRISGVCLSLNTISNFYVYCLTIPSFREFLWDGISECKEYLTSYKVSGSANLGE